MSENWINPSTLSSISFSLSMSSSVTCITGYSKSSSLDTSSILAYSNCFLGSCTGVYGRTFVDLRFKLGIKVSPWTSFFAFSICKRLIFSYFSWCIRYNFSVRLSFGDWLFRSGSSSSLKIIGIFRFAVSFLRSDRRFLLDYSVLYSRWWTGL